MFVILGLVLLVLMVAFLPRPVFSLDRVDFITTPCDPRSHSYQVTASMMIRNTGSVGGVVDINLRADGGIVGTGRYEVSAHESIQRGLSAIIMDCLWHEFTVELFVPKESG